MKALKNKTVVTILAAIICVVILGFSYDRRVKKKINAISVPVAKVDLKSRQEITSNDIEMISEQENFMELDDLSYLVHLLV